MTHSAALQPGAHSWAWRGEKANSSRHNLRLGGAELLGDSSAGLAVREQTVSEWADTWQSTGFYHVARLSTVGHRWCFRQRNGATEPCRRWADWLLLPNTVVQIFSLTEDYAFRSVNSEVAISNVGDIPRKSQGMGSHVSFPFISAIGSIPSTGHSTTLIPEWWQCKVGLGWFMMSLAMWVRPLWFSRSLLLQQNPACPYWSCHTAST